MQSGSKGRLFCSSIGKKLSKVCKILVERQSIQVSVFLFPRLFSAKSIMKVSVSLLRKLCIRIIIYLDDMLFMAASWEELLTAQDTVIYCI